jgi:hypothetical protein
MGSVAGLSMVKLFEFIVFKTVLDRKRKGAFVQLVGSRKKSLRIPWNRLIGPRRSLLGVGDLADNAMPLPTQVS